MSTFRPDEVGDAIPTFEVRVYRLGDLVKRELCESEEDAAAVVASWEDTEDVVCEVEDLRATRHDETTFEIEPTDAVEDFPSEFDSNGPT